VETTNYLLEKTDKIRFDKIKSAHVEPALKAALISFDARKAELLKPVSERNYENTMLAFELVNEELEYLNRLVEHLALVVGAEYSKLNELVSAKESEVSAKLYTDSAVYALIKSYAQSPEAKKLSAEKARFVEKTLLKFEREGTNLPQAKKDQLIAEKSRLAALTAKFSANVQEARLAWELVVTDPKRIEGLPRQFIEAAKNSAQAKGLTGYRFQLDNPTFIAAMRYGEDASFREEYFRGYYGVGTGGSFDNRGLIKEILQTRQNIAALLGFKDYADYVLQDRMAKDGAAAERFEADLEAKLRPAFERERKELLDFACGVAGKELQALNPWEMDFYIEKLRKQKYDFSLEDTKPYLSLQNAWRAICNLSKKLYGITIEETTELPTWDASVKAYQVQNEEGRLIAYFYADLFGRETKKSSAWMEQFVRAVRGDSSHKLHVGLIAMDLQAPTEALPCLMLISEVETLFHEFGHLLHGILSEVEVKSFSGAAGAWDYIELPSQLHEYWLEDGDFLKSFARHYKSGQVIPDALIQKLKLSKNFRQATHLMRQVGLGVMDLELHRSFDPKSEEDIVSAANRIFQRFAPAKLLDGVGIITQFTHVFGAGGAYACAYYSYLWALVLAADFFGRFEKEGLLNREVGKSLVSEVLSRGDSRPVEQNCYHFLGRNPQNEALLRRVGLLT